MSTVKRDVSSHLRAEHAMLDHCHSAVFDFFDVTTLSATSLEMSLHASLEADQMDVNPAMD